MPQDVTPMDVDGAASQPAGRQRRSGRRSSAGGGTAARQGRAGDGGGGSSDGLTPGRINAGAAMRTAQHATRALLISSQE